MAIDGHVKTTVYIRSDLYTKTRELNFNVTEFLNRCLEGVLAEENSDIPNLLNEERALRARLSEIQAKKSSIQLNPPEKIKEDQQKAQAEHDAQEARIKEQKEAQELFRHDPVAYAKKYLGGVE